MTPTHERPGSEASRLQARNWLLRQLGWERTLQLMRVYAAEANAAPWSTGTMSDRVPAHWGAEYGPARERRAS